MTRPVHPKTEYIIDSTEQNFKQTVLEESYHRLVLCDISADWCAPCNMLMPVLIAVVKEYAGQVVLAKVDADENMRIAGKHKVRGFPTVVAYVKGEEVGRFQSAQRKPFIHEFIERYRF